jgi:hypothetical protein
MTLARFGKKRDANEASIVQALRLAGCRVWHLDQPFDLLVGFRGRFAALEVKSTNRVRKDQQHQTDALLEAQAAGLPVYRIRTESEAIAAVIELAHRGHDER